jgi:hypothetical protein
VDAEEIGRLIGELEIRVERLRSLYEQYFMGIERIEPLTVRKDIDRRLWALRREQIRNTGLRFKLETTIQRYNTYQQYWQRIVREIEAGTYQRDLGRAAQRFGDNAVTGFAKRRQKMFEKAITKKAERDGRRTGPTASQAPPADADEAPPPPSSNETFDVTFEDSETAAPVWEPIEPLELDIGGPPTIPRPAPAAPAVVSAGERRGAPPAPGAPRAPAAARPAAPGVLPALSAASPALANKPVAPAAAQSGAGTAVAGRPWPPRAATPSTAGPGVPGAAAPKPPAPAAIAPKPAVPATPATKPFAAAPLGIKPAVPPTPAPKLGAPAALGPAMPISKPTAPMPAAPKAAASMALPPQAVAIMAKPASAVVAGPPGVRPPAAAAASTAGPKPAPPISSEETNLSPIRMRQIYGAFVEAKRRANESTASVTYEKIASNLESVAKELRAKHKARSVDFEVVMKNGKPVLKPVVKG